MVARLSFAVLALIAAPAAAAGASTAVPEGSNLTLYALGVAGVLVGRRLSSRRRTRDEGE